METFSNREPGIRRLTFSLFVYGTVTAMIFLVHRADVPLAAAMIPALWGSGALLPGWKGEFPPPILGLTQPYLIKGLKFYALSFVIVFPLFAALFYISRHLGFPVPTGTASAGVPMLRIIVYNITAVALFEELFFRGYLQDRFTEVSRQLFSGDRLTFWMPVTASAFLFGAAHVAVDLDPARIVVFFPALLFGWLKARTGSLVAPILSHATANVIFEMMMRWAVPGT